LTTAAPRPHIAVNNREPGAVARLTQQERNILGVLAVVIWLKVFRYVTITTRLERLFLTLARAVPDLVTYAFLFGLWIFAFSVSGILIFGNEVRYVYVYLSI
jgi:hypothetical protein